MENIIIFIILVLLGYFAGTRAEKKHYISIQNRERQFLNLPAVTFKNLPCKEEDVVKTELVYGSCVVSLDYFKKVSAALKRIFGGTLTSYETLLDRARREAVLRMKEMSPSADIILNIRLETSSIGGGFANRKNSVGSVEIIAYGTAITLTKQDEVHP